MTVEGTPEQQPEQQPNQQAPQTPEPPHAPQNEEPAWARELIKSNTDLQEHVSKLMQQRSESGEDDGIESVEELPDLIEDAAESVGDAAESVGEAIQEANPFREHGLFRRWWGNKE